MNARRFALVLEETKPESILGALAACRHPKPVEAEPGAFCLDMHEIPIEAACPRCQGPRIRSIVGALRCVANACAAEDDVPITMSRYELAYRVLADGVRQLMHPSGAVVNDADTVRAGMKATLAHAEGVANGYTHDECPWCQRIRREAR